MAGNRLRLTRALYQELLAGGSAVHEAREAATGGRQR
jgi:hypothetical protein